MSVLGATLLASALALGGSPPVQSPGEAAAWAFQWTAPGSCPDRAQVLAQIRELLPEAELPPERPARAGLRVEVEIVEAHGAASPWVAKLRTRRFEGDSLRWFSGASCAELADATALIVAVSLDPVLVSRRVGAGEEGSIPAARPGREGVSAGEVDGETSPLPALSAEAQANTQTRAEPDLDRDLDLDLDLGVALGLKLGGGWGPMGAGSGALEGELSVFEGRWRAGVVGGWWLPRTLRLEDGRGGRAQGWHVGARACHVWSWPTWSETRALELSACGGLEGGQAVARAVAPTFNGRRQTLPWAAALAGGGLRWVVHSRVAAVVDLDLRAALVRGAFVIGSEALVSFSPLGVQGAAGLELRF